MLRIAFDEVNLVKGDTLKAAARFSVQAHRNIHLWMMTAWQDRRPFPENRRRQGFFPLRHGPGFYTSLTSRWCGRSSGVEHNLAKVRVGRSNRLARSNWTKRR
jgi:hypothetical protein